MNKFQFWKVKTARIGVHKPAPVCNSGAGSNRSSACHAKHRHAEPELHGHGELGGPQVEPQGGDVGDVEPGAGVGEGHEPRSPDSSLVRVKKRVWVAESILADIWFWLSPCSQGCVTIAQLSYCNYPIARRPNQTEGCTRVVLGSRRLYIHMSFVPSAPPHLNFHRPNF